jgi:hypothetical protein
MALAGSDYAVVHRTIRLSQAPGLASFRQAPCVVAAGCRTSGIVPSPVALCRRPRRRADRPTRCNDFPESFHECVVPPTPFPVHADLDTVVLQEPHELLAGDLAPLVCIEDGRGAIPGDRLLHRIQAEDGGQHVEPPPHQSLTTRPGEDRKLTTRASRR